MREKIRITNSIMFAKVMEDEGICKELLERIFPEKKVKKITVTEKVDISIEKTFIPALDAKKIRLDVVFENDREIYDIEMQVENQYFLPKRMRYYTGAMDVKNLKSGESYDLLKPSYIIFICDFDYFGIGEPIYRFEYYDFEKGLQLGDESYKIVLNATYGNDRVSKELKNFFEYVHLGKVNKEDELINRIESRVEELSKREEVKSVVTLYDEMLMQKNIAREQGLTEGRNEGRKEGRKEGREEGRKEGREEGREEERQNIARNMRNAGIELQIIEDTTGLSVLEIENL